MIRVHRDDARIDCGLDLTHGCLLVVGKSNLRASEPKLRTPYRCFRRAKRNDRAARQGPGRAVGIEKPIVRRNRLGEWNCCRSEQTHSAESSSRPVPEDIVVAAAGGHVRANGGCLHDTPQGQITRSPASWRTCTQIGGSTPDSFGTSLAEGLEEPRRRISDC